jgi:hypothetical protein
MGRPLARAGDDLVGEEMVGGDREGTQQPDRSQHPEHRNAAGAHTEQLAVGRQQADRERHGDQECHRHDPRREDREPGGVVAADLGGRGAISVEPF